MSAYTFTLQYELVCAIQVHIYALLPVVLLCMLDPATGFIYNHFNCFSWKHGFIFRPDTSMHI